MASEETKCLSTTILTYIEFLLLLPYVWAYTDSFLSKKVEFYGAQFHSRIFRGSSEY